MKTLNLDLQEKSYPIYIGQDLLSEGKLLTKHISGKQVMIVTNTTVAPLYLEKVQNLLLSFEFAQVILPDGEKYKTLDTLNCIFNALLKNRFDRSCTLIALGGGVVGDMTGFAAASYQRGVNFIQIPTTLLSQVDSSVGGKTGINHVLGKNMIGIFHQPKCVLIDIDTLDTLNNQQYSAGMAEVIKYGLLGHLNFFNFLQENIRDLMDRNKPLMAEIIYQSCQYKINIVVQDELEVGKRALLNLGHTFGHVIENILGYGIFLHGEAISVGMLMAVKLSHLEGYLSINQVAQVQDLLEKANLPIFIIGKISASDFMKVMLVDKKVINGNIRLILLKELGHAFVCNHYKDQLLNQVINEFCQ
ncbi:3-dehydroquinate synthase [Candidatus Ruthia magnifica str. Cm (Calyptogena magnifica)]|uniref:3-dehydroquinate synthase n=1 Tax=Ruthia magnifica subsp. Calyptogena magnifica TaxID=413404 RepID=AROB_RUTMC|nr:3-dehydroquinate synthase [Candidatus Ruthturnera calyptogenae]A1AW10.1 RecName: Full=3-dehydroquinate synthase; Short=DHQS [Candidatus Ruthia magnifica str. Cm (Calyptogena magnifica)]ABL02117.1 3-dehydroquinate synthase [Candidatus Ruthia magnifica str. Cm (Calyptogena magnifica)]